MNICKPRRTNLYPYSIGRSRSIHVEYRPTGRLISIPPCHPHVHHQIRSCVYRWSLSPKPPRVVYVHGMRGCVTSATETRLACVSGWIVSHVTCVCAYNDTDVFDAGGIYREAGREAGRAPDGKKGCVSTQQEARCSIYTSENGISEDTARARDILQLISPLALMLGFILSRRRQDFLSLSCHRLTA